MFQLQAGVGTAQDTVVNLVAAYSFSDAILEQVGNIFVEIPTEEVRALHRGTLLGVHDPLKIAGLEGMVVLGNCLYKVLQLHGVVRERIVLKVELDFLNGLGEHKFMLFKRQYIAIPILNEPLVYFNYFLEIKFLKINIEPPHKKVHQIALFQFAGTHQF
jgi:hypothetical protein